ncbi:Mycobacterium rhizamassiliense ORFan [Mycobacterium rhizamassiliense]|jgi:hypothetical protein|uniref:Mycobacterium rhizamassiliense ORFan n=1 Tax=Mycobacterium rhizamassiliense TaxID=1841860 RepID=A0A2U3NVZ3_9MYCO|nr:hypothetical protein [Mycobacterium rhizamassiliense]SPM35687.1 Mycobacterium rhizamassiliense ORFan [Mycobacterium rhizamassiliense]
MRARFAVPALIVIVLSACGTGCTGFPDRQRQAEAIAANVRVMPGVKEVQPHYVNSLDRGASFDLNVEVDRTISPAAAAEIGRRCVTQVDRGGFAEHLVSLAVTFPGSGSDSDRDNPSKASFNLTDDGGIRRQGVTADQVGTDLQFWIDAVDFAGVKSVALRRPGDPGDRDGRSRLLDIHVANINVGFALEARYPELQKHWYAGL